MRKSRSSNHRRSKNIIREDRCSLQDKKIKKTYYICRDLATGGQYLEKSIEYDFLEWDVSRELPSDKIVKEYSMSINKYEYEYFPWD